MISTWKCKSWYQIIVSCFWCAINQKGNKGEYLRLMHCGLLLPLCDSHVYCVPPAWLWWVRPTFHLSVLVCKMSEQYFLSYNIGLWWKLNYLMFVKFSVYTSWKSMEFSIFLLKYLKCCCFVQDFCSLPSLQSCWICGWIPSTAIPSLLFILKCASSQLIIFRVTSPHHSGIALPGWSSLPYRPRSLLHAFVSYTYIFCSHHLSLSCNSLV